MTTNRESILEKIRALFTELEFTNLIKLIENGGG
jgi:hypothetical protein